MSGSGSTLSEDLERALDRLIHRAHVASGDELPAIVSTACDGFGATEAAIYLADLQQRTLVRFGPTRGDPDASPATLGIDATVAGRAYQQMQRFSTTTTAEDGQDRLRTWLPLLDGTSRLGVLGVTVEPGLVEDEAVVRRLHRLASVLAELLVSKELCSDSIVRARRTRPMSLAAEIQWSLLPPLTFVNQCVTIAGVLEPAYEVAGDSLDYAVDAASAQFAVFDGMGHGILSAQLISLVVAAYRNARRSGLALAETARTIEDAVGEVFRSESFATGLLCELDTTSGRLTWLSAGHHDPLLLREGRLVRALTTDPLLPFGLGQELDPAHVASTGTEQLEPGDMLLLYTDGVTEARSPDGTFFGIEGLVGLVTRDLAAEQPAPETMRRVAHSLLDHQAAELDDDATLLMVQWHGPPSTPDLGSLPSRAGRRALEDG